MYEPLEDLNELFKNSSITMDEDPTKWLKSVRDKLFTMFCSPMKEDYTYEAFKWVSHLCLSVGDFSWISPDDRWTKEDSKIFSCIARLSLSEVQILLPIIQRHLTCGDEPEIEDGKVLARSADSADYDRFGNQLLIVENVIKTLVKGQGDDDDDSGTNRLTESIKGEELKSLLERLKDVMTLICDYLELVHRHWESLTKQQCSEKFSSAEGALRLMSVYLSEDPGGFEPQCGRFLIDLVIKNLLLPTKSTKSDLLILALHSICTQDKKMLKTLKQLPGHEKALNEYLVFVGKEQSRNQDRNGSRERRAQKMFRLRCGLVKDMMSESID